MDSLRQVEKSTGKTPAELQNAPKLSDEHADVWEAYINLKEYTYSEVEAYMRVTGCQLDPWEVEAVMQLAKYKDAKPVWPLNTQH